MKTCNACKTSKPESDFGKAGKYLRSRCKVCRNQAGAKYRAENPEKESSRKRAWDKANPDKVRVWNNAKNRTWYAANSQAIRERKRAWKAENPHVGRAAKARRRALEKQATPTWADADKVKEFYFAADFLGMVTGDWYHVDHIVPLQSKIVCGLHTEQNLQVLPASANLRKSNRHWPDMP
jgi:hypothetical protein